MATPWYDVELPISRLPSVILRPGGPCYSKGIIHADLRTVPLIEAPAAEP